MTGLGAVLSSSALFPFIIWDGNTEIDQTVPITDRDIDLVLQSIRLHPTLFEDFRHNFWHMAIGLVATNLYTWWYLRGLLRLFAFTFGSTPRRFSMSCVSSQK
jgi:hypothetical protein